MSTSNLALFKQYIFLSYAQFLGGSDRPLRVNVAEQKRDNRDRGRGGGGYGGRRGGFGGHQDRGK